MFSYLVDYRLNMQPWLTGINQIIWDDDAYLLVRVFHLLVRSAS